ncbi:MAG: PAS domain S-box protein [Solirubrobacteraceae bacterium]
MPLSVACLATTSIPHEVEDRSEDSAAGSERARLAAIVECSQDAIFGKDRAGIVTVWNSGAQRLYGYAASEAIGRPVSQLVPEGHRGEDREILDRVLAGERIEHYQTERVCKDGSVVNVSLSVSPIHDAAGRVTGASSIARDVTLAIREHEQIALQAQLLDEVDAAVTLTDGDGVVRYWSRGAQQLYGYVAAEAVGRKIVDLITVEENRSALSFRPGAQTGRPGDTEAEVRDKQGRVFPVYVRHRGVSLGVRGRASRGLISVAIDITARRDAEQAIRRHAEGQEEIAALGRLALKGAALEDLFDHAVGAACRVLSADCGWLIERSADGADPVLVAEVGWPDQNTGERIAGEGRSLSGYAVRSQMPVVVQDWEQELRFLPSSQRLARKVASSVGVLVGDRGVERHARSASVGHRDSTFGVLEVQYTQPHAVPTDCVGFLTGLAMVLGEAIRSWYAQELIRSQSSSLEAMTESLRGLVSDKERLIEQIPGVVVVCELHLDGSGRFVFVSPQSEAILGLAPSELLGDIARFLQYVHPDDRDLLHAAVRKPAASGLDPVPFEFRLVRPDGAEVWLRGVPALVYVEREFRRIQAVLFDITAAKQAELERDRLELDLRLAQKLEAVGQLAAGLAHEINTPVQYIGNSVTFLKEAADELLRLTTTYHDLLHTDEPIDKQERQRRATVAEEESDLEYLTERLPPAFERALDGIERVSTIVRAMRQFAHLSTQRAPTDINEGLRTTLIVATSEYKYLADIELDLGELPLAMANGSELNQVFLNLIVNAAHAIESRTRDTDERGKITVRTRAQENGVLISVSDTGCGIPAEIAGRVFDPFFTTKELGRGTGQGLALAHTIIVERHHGAINFEPNPGGGTTFHVLVPLKLNDPATDSETPETEP